MRRLERPKLPLGMAGFRWGRGHISGKAFIAVLHIIMAAIIEIQNLKKSFPGKGKDKKNAVEAVRGITFSVEEGEIFGLLGPNGAGKTTTMRMLCTLLQPTSGIATIAGHPLKDGSGSIRKEIGYVSQVGGMQRESTGRENLMLQARLYGTSFTDAVRRVREIIELLGIESFADRKTVTYSGGQRRLFDLASGIVHRPKVLFLDEPSTGLDPQNRAHVWEQVKKLQNAGTTIFVTTHYLEEAEALCTRVAIVDYGKVVAIGTPEELKRQVAVDVDESGKITLNDVFLKLTGRALRDIE
jgi:ABC-2 type transport system ATP-binding protein